MRDALAALRAEDPAGRPPADLVVFPEATMASFAARSAEVAEPLDGPFADGVRALASEFGTTIAVGMFTPADAGRCNTLLCDGRGGGGVLRQAAPLRRLRVRRVGPRRPGGAPVDIEVGGVRVGLAICYDLRFPMSSPRRARGRWW